MALRRGTRWLALLALGMALVVSACRARDDGSSGPGSTPAATPTSSSTATPAAPNPVPPDYQAMYDFLAQSLDRWQQRIATTPGMSASPVFGAHLLTANANRGAALLAPGVLTTVDAELTRFKQLGIQGVTVTISFPILNADYPNAAQYLDFYARVAQHVRDRGMTFTVEQHVVFSNTAFSEVRFDYTKLPFDQFVTLFQQMTRQIVERVRPDYLTLLSEPDTFGKLTGYRQAGTPDGAAAFVGRVIQGVDRGTTKLGAGAGSWLPNAPDYDAAFAKLGLDYLDLHIYPVTDETTDILAKITAVAKAAGKPLVLDEAWLYKIGPGEKADDTFAQPTEAFRRDSFSFWQPLDARFLALVARFARANGVAYVAPFWSSFFFGYADYGPATRDLPYQRLSEVANEAVGKALKDGTFTSTGQAYGAAITGR